MARPDISRTPTPDIPTQFSVAIDLSLDRVEFIITAALPAGPQA